MIKNLIFDIGGVLLEYNPKTYLDKLNIPENIRKELNDIIFHTQKWRDCLNGFVSNQELIEYLTDKYPNYKKEIKEILSYESLQYMLPPKLDMIDYFHKLKEHNYKIYLCSNITEDTYNFIKNEFDIIQNADGGVFSCFENISKPDEKIYENLIDRYNLDVNESLFIDDTKKNIEIAKKLGFNTLLFNDIKQMIEIIEK